MVTGFQLFVAYIIVDALCLALTVVISSNVSRDSGSETQVRYFFLVLTSFLVFVVFDAVWAFFTYSGLVEQNVVALSILNCINMTAIAFAAYFWLCFTLARFDSRVTNSSMTRLLAAIPAVLVPVLYIIGFFMGLNMTGLPDEGMEYNVVRTGAMCIQLLYIVAATGIAVYRYRHATSRSEQRTSLVFMSFMVPFVIAGIVDSLIAATPVVAACIMASLVFVMMSMQESRISTDALTGLNNRRRADAYLEEHMPRASSEHPLHLFIIDLNKFKGINDTYGHLEGDRALRLTADALRKASSQLNAFAARWGGDEFVIICTEDAGRSPDEVAALVKETLADVVAEAGVKYELTCSIGYATCDSHDYAQSALISQADEMLYEGKLEKR